MDEPAAAAFGAEGGIGGFAMPFVICMGRILTHPPPKCEISPVGVQKKIAVNVWQVGFV